MKQLKEVLPETIELLMRRRRMLHGFIKQLQKHEYSQDDILDINYEIEKINERIDKCKITTKAV
jgi:hypothetical protein